MREGKDFVNAEELVAKSPVAVVSHARLELGQELAAAVVREVLWHGLDGGLPGRRNWDEHASWRVELWEEFLLARQRATAWHNNAGTL